MMKLKLMNVTITTYLHISKVKQISQLERKSIHIYAYQYTYLMTTLCFL